MPIQVKNYEEEVAKLSEEQALQRSVPVFVFRDISTSPY